MVTVIGTPVCLLVTLEWGNVKKAGTSGLQRPLLCTKVLCTNPPLIVFLPFTAK